jgi:hypothetical protein
MMCKCPYKRTLPALKPEATHAQHISHLISRSITNHLFLPGEWGWHPTENHIQIWYVQVEINKHWPVYWSKRVEPYAAACYIWSQRKVDHLVCECATRNVTRIDNTDSIIITKWLGNHHSGCIYRTYFLHNTLIIADLSENGIFPTKQRSQNARRGYGNWRCEGMLIFFYIAFISHTDVSRVRNTKILLITWYTWDSHHHNVWLPGRKTNRTNLFRLQYENNTLLSRYIFWQNMGYKTTTRGPNTSSFILSSHHNYNLHKRPL